MDANKYRVVTPPKSVHPTTVMWYNIGNLMDEENFADALKILRRLEDIYDAQPEKYADDRVHLNSHIEVCETEIEKICQRKSEIMSMKWLTR